MRARVVAATLAAATALCGLTLPVTTAAADHSETHRAEQQADRLRDAARDKATRVGEGKETLEELVARANAALDAYQQALIASLAAQAQRREAEARLAAATTTKRSHHERMRSYATELYRGGGNPEMALVSGILEADTPEQVFTIVGTLTTVGDRQSMALDAFRHSEAEEARARTVAAQVAQGAVAAAAAAEERRAEARRLMAAQRQRIAELQAAADAAKGEAEAAAEHAAKVRRAEEIARQRALSRPMGPVSAECNGGDVSGYPNGQLPEESLCPLWGAPGHALRADAAAAFNAMSKEYAGHFGVPICVTDSYRTYDEQVALKAAKPTLAATPGTSNHGWGLAVDLCGGVQNDGTETNDWLRMNAGRFAWFHPSWADAGGGGPYEPWHWEFAGG